MNRTHQIHPVLKQNIWKIPIHVLTYTYDGMRWECTPAAEYYTPSTEPPRFRRMFTYSLLFKQSGENN